MQKHPPFSVRDLRELLRVLRFVNTADPTVQAEAYRLAQKVERYLNNNK